MKYKHFKNFLLAICSSFSFFIEISLFKDIDNINYDKFLSINTLALLLLSIICIYIREKHDINLSKSKLICCILFSSFMIIGECMATEDTISIIYDNFLTLLISIIKFIGYINIFEICFYYLDKLISKFKNKEIKFKNKYLNKLLKLFKKYPFRFSLVCIILSWLIYIIAFYPIVLSPDPSYQLLQYLNIPTKYINWVIQRNNQIYMTTHHSVLHTYLLGWFLTLGKAIYNDNFGLFLYTCFQTIIYSSTLAYTIKFCNQNNVSNKWCLILLLIYMFVPMYGIYTVSANKDVIYTALMILYILHLFDIIKNKKQKGTKFIMRFFFIMLFLCLFRNNGIYIVIITSIFLIIYLKKEALKIFISIILCCLCIYSYNNILIPYLGISDGSIRETLSIFFQQTARYVKYYDEELSKEDKQIIDTILDYDTLASNYDSQLADPIKNKYNKYATTTDLKNYFKVWFKCLKKHPSIYIDATLDNTYGYYYPSKHNWYAYVRYRTFVTDYIDYSWNDSTQNIRTFLIGYINIFPYMPLLGAISNIAINTWLLFITSAYLITNHKNKYLLILIPMFLSFVFCLLSPANTYFRYAMPYIFVLPCISILLLKTINE